MLRLSMLGLFGLLLAANSGFGQGLDATVKLVDPAFGTALITIVESYNGEASGGIRIVELKIPDSVKIVTSDGKKVEGGIKSDVFKSPTNRPAVPVKIEFETVNGQQAIKKITLQ